MFFRPHFNTKQSTSLKKKPLAELSYHELLVSRNSLQIHFSYCYCAALALLGQGPEAYECFQSALMYFSRWLSVIETWEGKILACCGKRTQTSETHRLTSWHWCRTIQLNLIIYTHRAILGGMFSPLNEPQPHYAALSLSRSFSPRCLHREMVREIGLMESNPILRQIHIS